MKQKKHPESLIATALSWVDKETDAIGTPIRPSTSFLRNPAELDRAGRTFSRDDNPTYLQPESLINQLEGGAGCLLFASGMSAMTSVFHTLNPGDHVVLPLNVYSGLRDWLNRHGKRWGIEVLFLKNYNTYV